ncbi:MAG: hypothetical protein M5U01_25050 [Ardenticatenaceae bacterium]|nr:hypothetical protein [Ardenticatenaceae bacterium]HBY96799.1 hypothetical protein [Chloroflexota bacterium]
MAFYLVRARPRRELVAELSHRLEQGEFHQLRPFGHALTHSLQEARWDSAAREAVWEEEDYCTPPLAQERAAVLDRYFENLRVERVREGEGWQQIASLPSLWEPATNPDGEGARP